MLKCWITELDIKEKLKQLKLFNMDTRTYQGIIEKTAVFPKELGLLYPGLGLCGEAGEVAEKIKKIYRDNPKVAAILNEPGLIKEASDSTVKDYEEFVRVCKKELGDVIWYVTAIASRLDLSLEEIMEANYNKLMARRETGTLHGSGDDREEVVKEKRQVPAGYPFP